MLTFGLAMVAEQSVAHDLTARRPFPFPSRRSCAAKSGRRVQLFLLPHACCWVSRPCAWRVFGFCCKRTAFGRVVRAGVQNPDMVGALGISLEPYMIAVASLGVGLAGLAGVMLAPITPSIRRWDRKS